MKNQQKGSLTVFFLLMLGAIFFVTSVGLYVGRNARLKTQLINSVDSSALSMGNHYSAGLNLISAQNIAMGAQIHTASAMNFFGRYWALGQALLCTVDMACVPESAQLYAGMSAADNDKHFGLIYKITKEISGAFMQSAIGLSQMNKLLSNTWFLDTTIQGLETLRKNAPGSIAVPFKGSYSDRTKKPKPSFKFTPTLLKVSKVDSLFCHSISSSKVIEPMRDTGFFWVSGWVGSVANRGVKNIVDTLQNVEQTLRNLPVIFAEQLENVAGKADFGVKKKLKEYGVSCDNLPKDLQGAVDLCKAFNKLTNVSEAAKWIIEGVLPTFGECGLNDNFSGGFGSNSGDYSSQAQAFFDNQAKGTEFGFMFPDIKNEADLSQWENDHEIQIMALRPNTIMIAENQNENNCPEQWLISSTTGKKICNAPMGNLDFNQIDKLNPQRVLSRYQVATARATVFYDATNDDPTAAVTEGQSLSKAEAIKRSKFQLFWPSWRPKLNDTSLGALEYMGFVAP